MAFSMPLAASNCYWNRNLSYITTFHRCHPRFFLLESSGAGSSTLKSEPTYLSPWPLVSSFCNQAHRAHREPAVAIVDLRIETVTGEVQVIRLRARVGCAWPVAAVTADIFERSPIDEASCRQEDGFRVICITCHLTARVTILCSSPFPFVFSIIIQFFPNLNSAKPL